MTLSEKIKVMQHFEQGGEVEFKRRINKFENNWQENEHPYWDWATFDYRIKPKPVELLYEWWYKPPSVDYYTISQILRTEKDAQKNYPNCLHGKTGRAFDPEILELIEVKK